MKHFYPAGTFEDFPAQHLRGAKVREDPKPKLMNQG
jgi:hypothetical protein